MKIGSVDEEKVHKTKLLYAFDFEMKEFSDTLVLCEMKIETMKKEEWKIQTTKYNRYWLGTLFIDV